MNRFATLVAFVVVLGAARQSEAVTIKFCVTYDVGFTDSGQGEDNWSDALDTAPVPKAPRGANFRVYKGGVPIWPVSGSGPFFLGDGITNGWGLGCTDNITVSARNGDYVLWIESWGEVNYNYLEVRDDDEDVWAVSNEVTVSDNQATQYVEMTGFGSGTAFRIFKIYQATAYALYRHNGGNWHDLFEYELDEDNDGESDPTARALGTAQITEKFQLIHEAGHVMFENAGIFNAIDYDYPESVCHEEPAGQIHSMRSKEYAGTAVLEGFAHFYTADVWNDHNQSSCWFEYYKDVAGDQSPGVNCENQTGTTAFANAYLESACSGGADAGVELDWLRAFWDVHTDSISPAVDPTFTEIVDWLADVGSFPTEDAFSEVDAAADLRNDESDTNWNVINYVLDGL